ncbi:MAG: hypothetical protein WCV90_01715 [Candidatus Woesearchaeota archaeon]
MNWTKLLYVLIIVLIYVPMVFLGANVFFPKYTGTDSYYQPSIDCYSKYPTPAMDKATSVEIAAANDKQQKCYEENIQKQKEFDQAKNAYDGWKYVFIALFNLVIILFALFVPMQDSIIMGLFMGSIVATFGATIGYFQTNSKIGFGVLVVTFFVMLFFINRKKDNFVNWKEK